MLQQPVVKFSLFYRDFYTFHWHNIQKSMMNLYDLSLDETTMLICSTLTAMKERWDGMSEEPHAEFWAILHRKLLVWLGDQPHTKRHPRSQSMIAVCQEPVNAYSIRVA